MKFFDYLFESPNSWSKIDSIYIFEVDNQITCLLTQTDMCSIVL
uniref:Uncharacterized protein n=1 Tax=Rhizophora mucronata TaxID=61149 RepID=A0A2P2R0W3_RHIMU